MYILTHKTTSFDGARFLVQKRGVNVFFRIFEICIILTLTFTLLVDVVCQLDNRIMQRIDEKIEAKIHEKSE